MQSCVFLLGIKYLLKMFFHLVVFIARIGSFVLLFIVIFALFELRYDTLRRRDSSSPSVNASTKAFFPA